MATERVTFTNSRQHVLAGVLHGALDGVAVICCHGMLSTKDGPKHVMLTEMMAERGIAALRFDFSGRGESGGRLYDMTYSDEVDDLAGNGLRGRVLRSTDDARYRDRADLEPE